MIITINGSTLPNEMHHIAVALQRIAVENGYVVPVDLKDVTSVKFDPTPEQVAELRELFKDGARGGEIVVMPPVTQVVNEAGHVVGTVTLNDPATIERVTGTDNGVSVGYVVTPPVVAVDIDSLHAAHIGVTATLDSAGLPWDARIHAGSRERNTDGSWRVRRKPKDTDQEEWNATLARVTSELRDLMEIPVTPGAVADAAAETALTDAEIDQFVDIVQGAVVEPTVIEGVGSYTEVEGNVPPPATTVADAVAALNAVAPPVVVAPPAIEPPVTAVAPPIATASPAIETFAQVMTFLTARTPKDEAEKPVMVAKVNEILAANGLTVLTQLGQRPELIPQIVEQFNEAFGE